jgi:hypothetical protein
MSQLSLKPASGEIA